MEVLFLVALVLLAVTENGGSSGSVNNRTVIFSKTATSVNVCFDLFDELRSQYDIRRYYNFIHFLWPISALRKNSIPVQPTVVYLCLDMATSDDIDAFVSNPSWDLLEEFLKTDLVKIAAKYELSVKSSMRKTEVKCLISQHLINQNILTELNSDSVSVKDECDTSRPLEIRRMELEFEERQREHEREREERQREGEREERDRERQHQKYLREMELQQELRLRELDLQTRERPHSDRFDVTKHIRLVPKFAEIDADKYFLHFEKIALNLNWPKQYWPLLLQSVLIGKAQEAYAALSPEDSQSYDTVKAAVLKSYELVPEAYRQKFRDRKKNDSETYVEFAHDKNVLFKRWCDSKEVGSDFEKLRQIVLIEEFKKCISSDVRTYLDEKKVQQLSQAAVLADDYALTHKTSFIQSKQSSDSQSKPSANNRSQNNSRYNSGKSNSGIICSYCKKSGHLMVNCFKLQNKRQKDGNSSSPSKPVQLATKSEIGSMPEVVKSMQNSYQPFITEGHVSLSETSKPVSIKILRDTGASQTLILSGTVPLSDNSYTGQNVLLQGVGPEVLEVPLHKVYLNCTLVRGVVIVGVRPHLPLSGISLLLGNDLAGGHVYVNPIVSALPSVDVEVEALESQTPGVFPACAVTRSMAAKKSDCGDISPLPDERASSVPGTGVSDVIITLIDNGSSDHSVDLCDSFLQRVFEGTGCDIPDYSTFSKASLIELQSRDPQLLRLRSSAASSLDALVDSPVGYFVQSGVLMRKWRPPIVPADNEWKVVYQIVIPSEFRGEILHLAHETPLGGHLGVTKTYNKILQYFYWPGLHKDVTTLCASCHHCQMSGKPNQVIPPAPLIPVPAFAEPFSEILCDCVGPLPKTRSGMNIS